MTKITQTHCSCCARINPDSSEGYTSCCGKSLCHGEWTYRYGDGKNTIEACCTGAAWPFFRDLGSRSFFRVG